MDTELSKSIEELNFRLRLLKAKQEEHSNVADLTERDLLILGLLSKQGQMTVSQIAAADPSTSDSTISTAITRLWRDKKLVSKTISPENQRVTIVELTAKGREAFEAFDKQRAERFKALLDAINVTDGEKDVILKVSKRAVNFFDKYLGLDKNGNSR